MRQEYRYTIVPAIKRSLKGKTLTKVDNSLTDKAVNQMLVDLLGVPGQSAGKAQAKLENSIQNGTSTSAYSSAQANPVEAAEAKSSGSAGTAAAAGIGLIRDILGYVYAEHAANKAYERQNEYYDNHLSMQAKVNEYQEAGLNPMGLAGAGVGATSAPSVQQAQAPSTNAATEVLSALLNYKIQQRQIGVAEERNRITEKGIDSQIALREEQRLYQEKVNAWYDTLQMANLEKTEADTTKALAEAATEEQKSALLYQQAIAEYIRNKYAEQYNQGIIALQQAELRYKESATAENYARVKEINQHVQNMVLEGALTVAKTENMQQVTKNLGINEQMLRFNQEHQRADKTWQRIGQTIQSVQGITGAAANIFSCFTHIPAPPSSWQSNTYADAPAYMSTPSAYGTYGYSTGAMLD